MAQYNFDDGNIKWNTLTLPSVGELKHLQFSMLSVDEESHNVHVLFKFAANEKICQRRRENASTGRSKTASRMGS